jgi:hypothetical protein
MTSINDFKFQPKVAVSNAHVLAIDMLSQSELTNSNFNERNVKQVARNNEKNIACLRRALYFWVRVEIDYR